VRVTALTATVAELQRRLEKHSRNVSKRLVLGRAEQT
jgi:hypothetical protein